MIEFTVSPFSSASSDTAIARKVTGRQAMREAVATKPQLAQMANQILNKYIAQDYVGTNINNINLNCVDIVPQPGQSQRLATPAHALRASRFHAVPTS